jgi:hypothetical protein
VATGETGEAVEGAGRAGGDGFAGEKTAEVGGEVGGGGVAAGGFAFEALEDDRLEVDGDGGGEEAGRRGLGVVDERGEFGGGGAGERGAAGEEFEGDDAEGVEVARDAERGAAAGEGFGGEVVGRAEDAGFGGEVATDFELCGETEIGETGFVAVEEDVGRLEVAVEDALGVGGGEGDGDFAEERGGLAGREGPLAETVGEVAAVDVVHREIRVRGGAAGIVDGDDVRVAEAGDGLGFAEKTHFQIGGGALAEREGFEGDDAAEVALGGRRRRGPCRRGRVLR